MELIFSIFIIVLTASGQILLKKAVEYQEDRARNLKYICLGYLLFIITIILSYILMKLIELKYFTVIMSLNYIAVMFGANLFLNEKLNKREITGTIIVTVGVMIFIYGN